VAADLRLHCISGRLTSGVPNCPKDWPAAIEFVHVVQYDSSTFPGLRSGLHRARPFPASYFTSAGEPTRRFAKEGRLVAYPYQFENITKIVVAVFATRVVRRPTGQHNFKPRNDVLSSRMPSSLQPGRDLLQRVRVVMPHPVRIVRKVCRQRVASLAYHFPQSGPPRFSFRNTH
jgi:hypothetical protein